MTLGAVLLAAGESRRFGGNKLLADFCGKPLVRHALDALLAAGATRTAVVTGCGAVAELARQAGAQVIENKEPALGQARSVVLGVRAMADMDAVLLLAADMPLITGASLAALARALESGAWRAACLEDGAHWGNPAAFRRCCYPELLALTGDCGGKAVLRAQGDALCVIPCLRPGELRDADTPQALEALRHFAGRSGIFFKNGL